MSDFKITKAQQELIEKMGVVHERSGIQPAAARIIALLMISDRTELTFDEIQQTLGISKSSASVAINLLLSMNRIEYITRAGDRKRYFRSRIMAWREDMKSQIQRMTAMSQLLREILEQRPQNTGEFNSILAEVIDFMEFFQKEAPALFRKWDEKNK